MSLTEVNKLTKETIIEALEETPNYTPCTFCHNNSLEACRGQYHGCVCYRKVKEKKPLSEAEIVKYRQEKFGDLLDRFRLATYSMNTLTPTMIKTQLDNWAKYDNFVPKVVIIDYLDILAPSTYYKEERERRNAVNTALRNLSQEYKICIISATQTNKEGMVKKLLNEENFSEDKRILNHITGMIGLNQTPLEKQKGIMRVNKIVSRNEEYDLTKQCAILQNLHIGRPVLKSFYIKEEQETEKKEKE